MSWKEPNLKMHGKELVSDVHDAKDLYDFYFMFVIYMSCVLFPECLDHMGYMISTCRLTVCQPTPQAALKEIAKQIADRDNSVRNAALNCLVQVYYQEGEKVYKLVGNVSAFFHPFHMFLLSIVQ